MSNVEESLQEREVYGNAPGWAQGQRVKEAEPVDAAQEEAPPASDAAAAPSAAAESSQEQVSEQAPPPPSQPEPGKKFNMPPSERWDEIIRERDAARQSAMEAQHLTQLALERQSVPQPPQGQPQDPWGGLVDHADPATAQFWQTQRKLQEPLAQRVQGLEQAVQAGTQELAELRIENFRLKNPEIAPGSTEENAVVGYVRAGYRLNDAKKLALYDLKYGTLEAENRALKSKQALVPQKRAAANSEASAGIPNTAGLPPRPGDWRERVGEVVDKGGSFLDAANAIFGGPRH